MTQSGPPTHRPAPPAAAVPAASGILHGISGMPRTVLRYRGLIRAIVAKELAGRYSGTLLGPFWLLIPPAFMIFVYTVVFSQLMAPRLPGIDGAFGYSIYLCAGLLVWTPFLEAMQRAKSVFVDHANLIKKNAFPRPVLFVPVALVAAVNFALLALAFLVFLLLTRGWPDSALFVWVPACAALATLLGLAVGAVLATLNVFFRDVGQVADLAAQLLFWATPIVYPASIVPERVRELMALNPMYPLVRASQQAALGSGPVDVPSLLLPLVVCAVVAIVSGWLFSRARTDLLDRL